MKLPEILRGQGEYIWPFTRYTNIETIADAHRRVQSAVARPPHNKIQVSVRSVIITDMKTYTSEPALVISVAHKK